MELIIDPNLFLILKIVIALFIIFIAINFVKHKNKKKLIEYIVSLGLFLYVAGVVKVAIFPFHIFIGDKHPFNIYLLNQYIELLPFRSIVISLTRGIWIQVIGNIIMFVPLGVFIGLYKSNYLFNNVILLVFLYSLLIEITQLCISLVTGYPSRVFDTSDLILNTIGGLMGWWFLKILSTNLPANIRNIYKLKR
jgi:glycopeptide antibiotics resistance protein